MPSTSSPGAGQYALRSTDPFFQADVEEWRTGGVWHPLNGTPGSTAYPYLVPGKNIDWAYSPATREFIISGNGIGQVNSGEVEPRGTYSTIRVINKALTTEDTAATTHVRAQWIDGPGIAKGPSGQILVDEDCDNFLIRILRGGRDWNDAKSTPVLTPAVCEDYFRVSRGGLLNGNPPTDQEKYDAFQWMISCTELAYEGWDMDTGVSGCGTLVSSDLVADEYDDNGISDPVIWRPSTGVWWAQKSSNGWQHGKSWGLSTAQPIFGADFDGDRVADPAVKQSASGDFVVLPSTGKCPHPFVPYLGTMGCFWTSDSEIGSSEIPLPADYDGDGKTDIAARDTSKFKFIPTSGSCPAYLWATTSINNFTACTMTYGNSGDKPLISDFDGDGKTDVSLLAPGAPPELITFPSALSCTPLGSHWNNNSNIRCYMSLANSDDIPVLADYNGDGKTDPVWWSPADPHFRIWSSSSGGCWSNWAFEVNHCKLQLGLYSTDVPLAKQFNTDSLAEPTIFRPNETEGLSYWYHYKTGSTNPPNPIWGSAYSGNIFRAQWGFNGDRVEGLR